MIHLGYGLGAIFVNLLVRPFLGDENLRLNNTASFVSVSSNSNIKIPYSIITGLCFLIGVGHLIYSIYAKKNSRKKLTIQEVCFFLQKL